VRPSPTGRPQKAPRKRAANGTTTAERISKANGERDDDRREHLESERRSNRAVTRGRFSRPGVRTSRLFTVIEQTGDAGTWGRAISSANRWIVNAGQILQVDV
jgi:hypothetical protein